MIEVLDEAVGGLRHIDIRLDGDIDLRAGCMPGQSRQAIECLADRIESRDGNSQRSLLLGLRHDLIDLGPQLEIGVTECLFRRKQRDRGAPAGSVFLDGVG